MEDEELREVRRTAGLRVYGSTVYGMVSYITAA